MRRFALAALTLVLLVFGGASAYLKLNETSLVFHPADRTVAEPPDEFGLRQRPVHYRSSDGTKLTAWIVPGAGPDSSGYWLLINHGNYGNIGYGDRPDFYSRARDTGLNLLAYDYRGFGASDGTPTELGVYADAEASFRYLTDSLSVPADRIVIFGHSLGSGVAIELATRVPSAALVVEGAYTAVTDRGQELYPFLPVKLLASQRFASIDKIARVRVPKVFLHSPSDDIIPFAHGERLFRAAAEPKRFVPVAGGHMEAFKRDDATYFGAIRSLLASVNGERAAGGYPATRH